MRSTKHFWPIPLIALALVAAMLCAPTASAQTAAASASAKRIADICGKRAKRATRGVATASRLSAKKRRRAAWRRCVLRLRRTGADHPGRGKRDTTAPIVVWTFPATGSTVSGELAGAGCEAQASDDRSVERVVFRVDGASLNTEVAAPYNCSFDTSAVTDGIHTLTATAYDSAGNSSIASTTIVVANVPEPEPSPAPEPDPDPVPEPEPSPDPVPEPIPVPVPAPAPEPEARSLAIGIDGGHDEWWDDTIEARAALGAAVTRHEWDPADPIDSRDGLVLAAATEVHTRIHALLGANELGDPVHYRDWVVAFVRRYGRDGSFWDAHPTLDESRYAIVSVELGNEPYFGAMSATEYADTVRPTLQRIAELGLPVKVILPSYIHGSRTTWIDTLYERIPNLNSLFYAFADHPYWYGHHPADTGDNGPFARIQTLRQRMNHHGAASKPIFLTEYGESTASCGTQCVSEATQAVHLKAMLDAVVSRTDWGVEMVSFFQLHDWATNSSDREKQFGLLRQNGTQKPSYSIIRSAMQQYRG